MITLKKLYFQPNENKGQELKSVSFDRGLNFIIGEKSISPENKKEKDKMNGVGKSLLIESINYCLLKKSDESRLSKISDMNLDPEIYVCLDLEIESPEAIKKVTIRRNRAATNKIVIDVDDHETAFDKLDEARKYLNYLCMGKEVKGSEVSFRSLLSILIREEKSLYDDILKPHPNSSTYPFADLLKPHLYLFQIDLIVVDKIKKATTDLKLVGAAVSSLKGDFKKAGVNQKEVASHINELTDNIEKLNLAIDELHPAEGLIQTKNRFNELQVALEKLVSARAAKEYTARKIKSLPQPEKINTKQVQIVYNHFKAGLGDLVEKSFEQVLGFKKQLDDFQSTLLDDKLKEINAEIAELDSKIAVLDTEIGKLYEKTEAKGKIDGLKQAISLEREKNIELEKLSGTYNTLEAKLGQQKALKKKRAVLIDDLNAELTMIGNTIASFEEDLKKMHESIAGNKHCHFKIDVKEEAKEFVEFNYRIKLDGSSGINRIRTFIYDTLLMVNKVTSQRHPRFLIHDNIFASTGLDDRVQSLNYLYGLSKTHNFQYILTINKDEFEAVQDDFDFKIEDVKKAEFTRDDPFLGFEYSEI